MSDDPDPERVDGLTITEAVLLCVRRSGELSLDDTDFIVKLTRRKPHKPLRSDEIVRLRGLVVRLRHGADDAAA